MQQKYLNTDFTIKIVSKLGTQATLMNFIQGIHQKPSVNIVFEDKTLGVFLLKKIAKIPYCYIFSKL